MLHQWVHIVLACLGHRRTVDGSKKTEINATYYVRTHE